MELPRRSSLATLKITWLVGLTQWGIPYLQALQQKLHLIRRCSTANMKSSGWAFCTWHKTFWNSYSPFLIIFKRSLAMIFSTSIHWSEYVGMVKCVQGDVKTQYNGSRKKSIHVDNYCLMLSEQEKLTHKRKGNSGAATLPCHAGQISADISRYCQMTCLLRMSTNIRQPKIRFRHI